jgi:hypothetical protein
VQQPDRGPVPVAPSKPPRPGTRDCTNAASELLDCLGVDDPQVKCVRIKSVSLEVDLHDKKCNCKHCKESEGKGAQTSGTPPKRCC